MAGVFPAILAAQGSFIGGMMLNSRPKPTAIDLNTVAKEINQGEPFIITSNEDIFEYSILPAFRAIRRQIFGGSCDTEEDEKRALDFWQSKRGEQLRACLYDYAASELMKKAASIDVKK